MKKLLCFITLTSLSLFAGAQTLTGDKSETTSPYEVSLGTDIVSRYVWRGTDFGHSPSIQPTLKFSAYGVSFGAWGAFTTANTTPAQEADLFLSYTTTNSLLTFTVNDYFFPNETTGRNHYFNYNENETGHVFEGTIALNQSEKMPFGLMAGYNFYGADKDNSIYLEASYSTTVKDLPINLFCGATTDKGIYGTEAGVINLGVKATKEIKVTETFKLPIYTSVITNPQAGNIFIVLGITL